MKPSMMQRLGLALLLTLALISLAALTGGFIKAGLELTPAQARQQFQDVLIRYGSAQSPVAALHYTGAGQVYGDHPGRIRCTVAVSTATTVQAVGGSCVAPGATSSIYITDVKFGTSAAAGTAADSFPTLKSGTGGTCGAATAVVWQALTAANTTVVDNLTQPIKLTANHELCWIMTTAGSKTIDIVGYIAP